MLLAKIVPHIKRAWTVTEHCSDLALTKLASTEWLTYRSELFIPDFLVLLFKSPYFREKMIESVSGMGSLKRATPKALSKIWLPLPPQKEQHRILDRLNSLLTEINRVEIAYTELLTLGDIFRKQVLQKAIQGKLVPQLESEPVVTQIGEALKDIPFMIPTKWKWVTLGAISKKIHYGYTASAKEKGNARLLRITDIQNESVNWSSVPFCSPSDKEITKFKLNAGDIVIARTGGTIGKSYLISDEIEKTTVFASYLIRVIPEVGYVDPAYLQAFLRSPCYWGQLIDGSRRTGQPNVKAQALSEIKVPLPSIQEQHRIVQKLKELSDKVEITT